MNPSNATKRSWVHLGGASATADRLSQLTAFPLARLLVMLFGLEGFERSFALEQAFKTPQRFFQRLVSSDFHKRHRGLPHRVAFIIEGLPECVNP